MRILTETLICADFKNLTRAYMRINKSLVLHANATILIFLF